MKDEFCIDSEHGFYFKSIIISARPDILVKIADKTTRRPVFSHVSGYKMIRLNEPTYENSQRYLSLLFHCMGDSSRSASWDADIASILSVMHGRRSPLLLLLAFIASFQTSGSSPVSQFQVLKSICSENCRLTITRRIDSPADCDEEDIRKLVKSFERLTMCYALSIRLVSASIEDVASGSFMERLFGLEASRILLKDVDYLCSQLDISESAALPTLLHTVFQTLSGFLISSSSLLWPFVHKCFEDYYCGLFLEEVGRRSLSSAVFELVLRNVLSASISTESFFRETVLKQTQWRLALEIAVCQGGPYWLLSIFAPTIHSDLLRSSSALSLAGSDRAILSSRIGFLLMICELDSTEHCQASRTVIDRIAGAHGADLTFPADAEVNLLLVGASGKRAGLLKIIQRILSKRVSEVKLFSNSFYRRFRFL